MEFSDVSNLLNALRDNTIVVYGAGYVAIRFYQALKKQGLSRNVKYFVTSPGSDKDVEGLPVKKVSELENSEDIRVCIAVHETIKDEIIRTLQEKNITQYVWIYPFLNELMLGAPVRGKQISLKDIWVANREAYAIAVRYLAIENYYGENDNGYEIYKRSLSLFNSQATSEKRLGQFIHLIKNWEEHGYNEKEPVSLLEDGRIVDGLHRITMALYHRQESIMSDVFLVPEDGIGVHEQTVSLTRQSMIEAGVEDELIELLEEVNRKIGEQFV